MVRVLGLILAACFLIASAPPEPPAELEPYIVDGKYDPGDFGWLRGRFEGAKPEEVQNSETIDKWITACFEQSQADAVAVLTERGVVVSDADRLYSAPLICIQVSTTPDISSYSDFDDFSQALAQTQAIFDALSVSADRASSIMADPDASLADQLKTRTLKEQMLRHAFEWVWYTEDGSPSLTARQKPIFAALLGAEMSAADDENTQWLKGVVAEEGWPTVSKVGKRASHNAWLLVQHANLDPVFQFDVLRLMEPLVAQGEVSARNYAYLYDRVMLKITGKQRYATQMWCQDGKMEPQPLEDPEAVSEQRAAMELEPFEEYRKNFPETCE